MPRFDGTGSLGEGPMTGRSGGFCLLKRSDEDPGHLEGLAGLQGEPVGKLGQVLRRIEKKMVKLSTGESMGSKGLGSTTQTVINLSPRFKVLRYMSHTVPWWDLYDPSMSAFGPFNADLFRYSAGYTVPYTGRSNL